MTFMKAPDFTETAFYFEDPEGNEHEVFLAGYFTPGTRGRLSGPPEDCFPDESAEVEIVSAKEGETVYSWDDLVAKYGLGDKDYDAACNMVEESMLKRDEDEYDFSGREDRGHDWED